MVLFNVLNIMRFTMKMLMRFFLMCVFSIIGIHIVIRVIIINNRVMSVRESFGIGLFFGNFRIMEEDIINNMFPVALMMYPL